MEIGMEIHLVAKGLKSDNHCDHVLAPGVGLEIAGYRPKGQAAEFPQEAAVIIEEYPKHSGQGEDDLAVGKTRRSVSSIHSPLSSICLA